MYSLSGTCEIIIFLHVYSLVSLLLLLLLLPHLLSPWIMYTYVNTWTIQQSPYKHACSTSNRAQWMWTYIHISRVILSAGASAQSQFRSNQRNRHRNRNRFCTFPKLCSNISFYNLPFRKDFHVSPFKVLHTKVERVRKRDNESLTKDNFDTFGLETRLQLVSYTY